MVYISVLFYFTFTLLTYLLTYLLLLIITTATACRLLNGCLGCLWIALGNKAAFTRHTGCAICLCAHTHAIDKCLQAVDSAMWLYRGYTSHRTGISGRPTVALEWRASVRNFQKIARYLFKKNSLRVYHGSIIKKGWLATGLSYSWNEWAPTRLAPKFGAERRREEVPWQVGLRHLLYYNATRSCE